MLKGKGESALKITATEQAAGPATEFSKLDEIITCNTEILKMVRAEKEQKYTSVQAPRAETWLWQLQ
ncbi:hypothetical protein WJX77_004875 [Trebouxia sp. C0004]